MRLFKLLSLFLMLSSTTVFADDKQWDDDQKAIIEVNRFVPLALKEVGFEGYSQLFHPEYTNWYMVGDKESLTERELYLSRVKKWFEKGNYANYSKVVPISIEVFGEIAYVRHLQEEHFVHPDGKHSMFVGHFASLMKKHQGKWTFYRTSFEARYRGPIEEATTNLDNY